MQQRIIGIDVARAIAVFGMIIVNFKMVIGSTGDGFAKAFTGLFEGKAAATFVVLAGIGIALMSKSAYQNQNIEKIQKVKVSILKRAVVLFIIGSSYLFIWPADILHFYGIYMLLTLLLINRKSSTILLIAITIICFYPLLMWLIPYDTGWNFENFSYYNFWSVNGFIRNLFYNGFHPVLPWASFMLIGLWYGRQNLNDDRFIKKSLIFSLAIYILFQLISSLSISLLSQGNPKSAIELTQILGTSPMPPLPFYMFSGSSIAIFIISFCILVSRKFPNNLIIHALNKTGKLALTFYVAHVIIGMGAAELFLGEIMGASSASFSLVYAILFSLICMAFAIIWLKFKATGPLEHLMKKITA